MASNRKVMIPASDISEHISTAGAESCDELVVRRVKIGGGSGGRRTRFHWWVGSWRVADGDAGMRMIVLG